VRLAPPDATLLTDEISCVRQTATGYHAFGTPFAGELGIPGEEIAAPIAALYFLRKGPRNGIARSIRRVRPRCCCVTFCSSRMIPGW